MNLSATYSLNGAPAQPAHLLFLKDRLQINLLEEGGRQLSFYWYYEQVAQQPGHPSTFTYLDYPPQVLQLASSDAAAELQQRVHGSRRNLFTRRRSTFFKVAAGVTLALLFAFFILVPWIAQALTGRFPVSYEKRIGDEMFRSLEGRFEVDAARTSYINDFFASLNVPSRYNIRITVVKNNETNAFAMPGGHIVVYSQLIDGLNSYPELAALLLHEYAHVQNRHSLKSLFRSLSYSILLALVAGNASAVAGVLVDNASNLENLSYSRSLEKEADEKAAALMAERSIDCNGFVRLFQFLQRENKNEVAEWISSHPDLNKRIRNIREHKNCRQQTAGEHELLHVLFAKLKIPS
jgi:beta-barrel assembly-enhancing protease